MAAVVLRKHARLPAIRRATASLGLVTASEDSRDDRETRDHPERLWWRVREGRKRRRNEADVSASRRHRQSRSETIPTNILRK